MNQFYRVIHGYLDSFISTLSRNRKVVLRYLLFVVPGAIYFGMISFIGDHSGAAFFLKSFQVFMFLFAGTFHVYLVHKDYAFLPIGFYSKGIMYTISTAAVITITLLFFYLFTVNSMAGLAFTSGMAFALPHVIVKGWMVYKAIPKKEYPVWTRPVKLVYVNEVLIPETVNLRFQLAPRHNNAGEHLFFRIFPEGTKLGKAFFSMLKEEAASANPAIDYCDASGNAFAWEFYRLTMNGLVKKRLNPEDSIYNNRISNSTIVHVKRVQVEVTQMPAVHTIRYKTISESGNSIPLTEKKLLELYAESNKN
ncbi:MAG: TssN family type VI secretion system protein [Chitinophagaceae bacterium]